MRYVIGTIVIILAILMMRYTVQLTNIVGKVGMAEDYLRFPGAGTYTFWRLLGAVFIVVSLLWMFHYINLWPTF